MAISILVIAMAITMGAFLSILKRTLHSERLLRGATEMRYSTDLISQAVRSAPLIPLIQTSGRQLLVAPKDLGYAMVLETTWIDILRNVKGSKGNQRMLHVSDVTPAAVVTSVFSSTSRPSGVLSAAGVATYFKSVSALPTVDLTDVFAAGDSITIPATSYGSPTVCVINNISNSPGSKTLTLTAAIGVDVPNGTAIMASGGRRILFSVEVNGDVRYYPDNRDMTRFSVIAREVDPAPLTTPSDTASARTVPFAITGRYLTFNFQKIPRGTMAGRTVQGVQTTVLTRTDPLAP